MFKYNFVHANMCFIRIAVKHEKMSASQNVSIKQIEMINFE